MVKHIPNFITLLNLASGFLAIVFTASGDILTASWLILAAMLFDFADGFAARLLKAYSDIGKELDSLADVVSFGVAPGYIIFSLISKSLHGSESYAGGFVPGNITANLMLLSAIVMPACAALRLAVFNTDTTQSTGFKGLPTPANALAVISLVIGAVYSDGSFTSSLIESPVFLSALSLVLSVLMVSRIPLLSLKTQSLRIRGNEGRYLLAALILLTFIVAGMAAAPFVIPVYIAVSLVSLLF